MAIIKCKECGGDISDKAKKCPHCGANAMNAIGVKSPNLVRFVGLSVFLICVGLIIWACKLFRENSFISSTQFNIWIYSSGACALFGLYLMLRKYKKR